MSCQGEIEPLYIVASQLNTLTAEGIATVKCNRTEDQRHNHRLAAGEHVVTPNEETKQCDRDTGKSDERVPKDFRFAASRPKSAH